tara:strand:+ start:411 stop:584 length:174 start_codon:yes stop_codon:yes gene_type:complete
VVVVVEIKDQPQVRLDQVVVELVAYQVDQEQQEVQILVVVEVELDFQLLPLPMVALV